MARLGRSEKAALAKSADKVSLAGIATGPAAYFAVLIPVAGPFIAGGLVLAGAALGARAVQQNRLADDPPRDDFDEQTTLGPPIFSPRVLGGIAFEEVVVNFVRVEDELARILEAMVIAVERTSGAELASNSTLKAARTSEVVQFAEMLSSRLETSSAAAGDLRESLKTVLSEHPTPTEIPDFPPNLATSLGESLTGELMSMGVPGLDLAGLTGPVPDDPIAYIDSTFAELAGADHEFGRRLNTSLSYGTLLEFESDTELGA